MAFEFPSGTVAKAAVLAGALLSGGCNVEADCRDGIRQLQPRVDGAIGTGEHAEANQQIAQAYTELGQARERADAGDFAGCVQKLESARVLLNKAQRTNQ